MVIPRLGFVIKSKGWQIDLSFECPPYKFVQFYSIIKLLLTLINVYGIIVVIEYSKIICIINEPHKMKNFDLF